MDKLLFKRILIGLLSVLILAYLVYLFFGANFSKSVETEDAVFNKISDTIYSNGFIIRDESYVSNSMSGVLSYNVSDGEDVSAGQNIADIYKNETDAVYRQKIHSIDNQIKKLKELSDSYHKDSVSLEAADSQIANNIYSFLYDVNLGKLSEAKSYNDELLLSICERQMITGEAKEFSAKIESLKTERDNLCDNCSESIGAVAANKAGYFITKPDGYEESVNLKKLNKLYPNSLKKLSKKTVFSNIVGKVVTSPQWYIACEVTADDTVNLAKLQNSGETIYVMIPSVTSEKLPVKIHMINQKSKKDSAVLILSCDYMNSHIASARKENIEISTVTYSGLKVSKRAIHENYVTKETEDKEGNIKVKKKKVQGVYVQHGSELIFKQIYITYSGSDYVLCNPTPPEGILFNGKTVELYDRVVIKGDNLYDGKIIK